MRLLYHHRARSRDGQAIHIEKLIAAFRSLGHDVAIVEPPSFRGSSLGTSSPLVDWLKRRLPRHLYETAEVSYNIVDYVRLRRAYRRFKPDAVYERYNLFSLAGVGLRRRYGVPLLLEVNAPLARERDEFGGLGFRRLARFAEAWTWRNASHVFPVTRVLADIVGAAGVPADRIHVIANGVDLPPLAEAAAGLRTREEFGLTDKTVLGFVGFMRTWHGLDQIVELLARPDVPPSLHLFLIGEGPALPDLMKRAQQLNIASRITFAGVIDNDRIGRYIAAFDIALQPRAVAYASPLKIFEYMAWGRAIVAPDQPNIREILTHDRNAWLFDPQRPGAAADAILRLAGDAERRRRLGDAARTAIEEAHRTWADNARQVSSVAERAIAVHR